MYMLLCAQPPFPGLSDVAVLARVRRGVFGFDGEVWSNVSEDAKDLIRGLLTMDPSQRFTGADGLRHVWTSMLAPKSTGVEMSTSMIDSLVTFQRANKLKKAALQVIANHMHRKEIQKIHDAFIAIDEQGDNNGMIPLDKLKMVFGELGSEIPDLENLVKELSCRSSPCIDYNEFVAATLDKNIYSGEEACWTAFNLFDINGDGVISVNELTKMLNSDELPDGAKEQMLEDIVGEEWERGIDFDAFLGLMRQTPYFSDEIIFPEGPRVSEARRRKSVSDFKIDKPSKRVTCCSWRFMS